MISAAVRRPLSDHERFLLDVAPERLALGEWQRANAGPAERFEPIHDEEGNFIGQRDIVKGRVHEVSRAPAPSTPKTFSAPVTVTGADGPMLVPFGGRGTIRPVEGYGPPKEPSQREKRIREYMVPFGLSRGKAVRRVDNQIEVNTDPLTGQARFADRVGAIRKRVEVYSKLTDEQLRRQEGIMRKALEHNPKAYPQVEIRAMREEWLRRGF